MAVTLFNDLYLSSSFLNDPAMIWVLKAILSHSLLLVIKITGVYYVILSLIPRWIKAEGKLKLGLEALLVFFLLMVAYRLMTQFIIWPYIYNEHRTIPFISMIARYLYSLLDILQVVAIAAAIKLFRLRIEAIKKEKLLQQEKSNSELMHLRSQVNPHFLFNSLNNIFSLARSKSERTADVVLQLSNILRYTLYESDKKLTTLENELKIIDDYIKLQQTRFGDKLGVIKQQNIHNVNTEITPLLLLPLVENCFKHGNIADNDAQIMIQIDQVENILNFKTKNRISEASVKGDHEKGIGLTNIKRQLELLYRNYKFNYFKEKDYFIVNLEVDLGSYAGIELFDSRG
ncbi:MAG: histidine kinase [Alphaproteobacteria bacterium]|nr:histidine kinase [Alphaproteobacteria bacterium]